LAYVAPTADIGVTTKAKKEKKAKDLSEEEKQQMDKLKNDIVAKKAELKAEGVSGGQINKNSDIVEWVNKLNALKEKEAQLKGALTDKDAKKEEKSKKGDVKEIARLKDEMDAYKLKLKEEFGYSKQDVNKDPDLVEMQQRYKEMGGK
jgi:type II secretory pathway component PulJ